MNPLVRRLLWIAGSLVAVILVAIIAVVLYVHSAWDTPHDRPVVSLKASTDPLAVARGEYLFKYGHACWGCHSPKPDAAVPPSGGRAFDLRSVGPGFGIFYARNITPDPETGIGAWSDGEIVRALREGLSRDGTVLFPIMPIEAFHGLSDEDALAIVSYLRSLPPIRNAPSRSELSFATKALYTFGIIGPAPAITEPIVAPPRGKTVEYGRYLANYATGCMDCHTPRNLEDGSFYRDSLFAGSTIRFGEDEARPHVMAYATNITPDPETGIGKWTEEQFLEAVRAGMRPDGTVLSTHMPYGYFGLMDEEDLGAIFLYLQSIKPFRRVTEPVWYSETYRNGVGLERGKAIFEASCMLCHGEDGKGAAPTKLSLAEIAPTFTDKMLIDFVTGGNVGLRMPAFGKTLSKEQILDVVAYIRSIQHDKP
ncbi:MAG: alcohol dehydrogenase [Bacteroidia bacterium]|nr:MAG: alcohol dehydrogenase [Bacteroidia bacterium]